MFFVLFFYFIMCNIFIIKSTKINQFNYSHSIISFSAPIVMILIRFFRKFVCYSNFKWFDISSMKRLRCFGRNLGVRNSKRKKEKNIAKYARFNINCWSQVYKTCEWAWNQSEKYRHMEKFKKKINKTKWNDTKPQSICVFDYEMCFYFIFLFILFEIRFAFGVVRCVEWMVTNISDVRLTKWTLFHWCFWCWSS